MPELPEVETERRYLDRWARWKRIISTRLFHADILSGISALVLGRKLKGHAIQSTHRHGKYLFAGLDSGDWLAMHFGMTGTLKYYKQTSPPPEYVAMLILFDGGHNLAYVSRRRLGNIALISNPDDFIGERRLGPDALSVSAATFAERLTKRESRIKPWLMDQSHVAGIGNEYSDEILFQARIHPERTTTNLSDVEVKVLYRTMVRILKKAIAVRAEPQRLPATWLLPQRGRKSFCPRCGGPIRKTTSGGRAGYHCPKCQRR